MAFPVGPVEVDMEQNAALARHVHSQATAAGSSANRHAP